MGQRAPDPFDVLAEAARELGDEATFGDLVALRRRLDEGRFFVACVGQFKRGKSTLVNALVEAAVLPVGVVPVTAVITVVRHGPEFRARVRTEDAADWVNVRVGSLDEYVTEAKNPQNERRVRGVEVDVPAALLASGMCLVDTPGLGSVFAGNTEATREFVPHIDAALVVLGADPPISGQELDLVAEVAQQAQHLVFVINKADRLSAADIEQARLFTREVVAKRLGRAAPAVLVVSATERLAGHRSRDWDALEGVLGALARDAGADLVEAARRRGLLRATTHLSGGIEEHRAALLRPIEESERRVEALSRAVADAERALGELEPLFRVEEEALRRGLEARRAEFLQGAADNAVRTLRARLEATAEPAAALHARVYELAQELAREHVEAWAHSVRPDAEVAYRKVTDRFVALGNDFLRRLKLADPDAFGVLPSELEPETGLRARSEFFFTEMLTIAAPPPGVGLLDALRSRERAIRAAHKRASPYLLRLLETNSARVINDLGSRVRESGRSLRSDIASRLRAVATTAKKSADWARASQARGDESVRAELARLDVLAQHIATVEQLGRAV
jgi:Dynamin family